MAPELARPANEGAPLEIYTGRMLRQHGAPGQFGRSAAITRRLLQPRTVGDLMSEPDIIVSVL